MSCIAAVWSAPEPQPSQAMQAALSAMARDMRERCFLGPDTHLDECAGLLQMDGSPATWDGGVWAVCDARIDGRESLAAELRQRGLTAWPSDSAAKLLIQAYRTWGDHFPRHVLGDCVFVIWDAARKKLLAGRDHLGVRPLYVAEQGSMAVLASDVDAVRSGLAALTGQRPVQELDDDYIADFLLFGHPVDHSATVYRQIRQIPPGSIWVRDEGGSRVMPYWIFPPVEPIRYARRPDYVAHFKHLLAQAVADRVPASPVVCELTGGMDSNSLLAMVVAQRDASGAQGIHAYTIGCPELLPLDQEPALAAQAAAYHGIGHKIFNTDHDRLFQGWDQKRLHTPEPSGSPCLELQDRCAGYALSVGANVVVSGTFGDAVLGTSNRYVHQLWRQRRYMNFAAEVWSHGWHTQHLSGLALRSLFFPDRRRKQWRFETPPYLVPSFVQSAHVEERIQRYFQRYNNAYDTTLQLRLPFTQAWTAGAQGLRSPVRWVYPFLDLRLVNFLRAVPSHVKADKWVMREAMRGRMPESIRMRPKTALQGDPDWMSLRQGRSCIPEVMAAAAEQTSRWIDTHCLKMQVEALCQKGNNGSTFYTWLLMYAIGWMLWQVAHARGNRAQDM